MGVSGSQAANDPHSGYPMQAASDPHSGYVKSDSQEASDPQFYFTERLANLLKAMEELIRGTTDVRGGSTVSDKNDAHSGYMLTDSKTSDPHSGYVAASTLKQHTS